MTVTSSSPTGARTPSRPAETGPSLTDSHGESPTRALSVRRTLRRGRRRVPLESEPRHACDCRLRSGCERLAGPTPDCRNGRPPLVKAAAADTAAPPWRRRRVRTIRSCCRASSRASVFSASDETTACMREAGARRFQARYRFRVEAARADQPLDAPTRNDAPGRARRDEATDAPLAASTASTAGFRARRAASRVAIGHAASLRRSCRRGRCRRGRDDGLVPGCRRGCRARPLSPSRL
jgi:hypothetical protein